MPLIIALLKINVTLALCYLLYYCLLRKLTFYQLNRAFFLGSIALSGIMPLIRIRLETPAKPVPALLVNTTFASLPYTAPTGYDYTRIIQVLFVTGLAFMGALLLLQLLSVARMYSRSTPIQLRGVPLRRLPEAGNPFTFFRSIFLYPDPLSDMELKVVIAHEQVHAGQWHSIDILVAAVCRAFCWFNPAAWLLLKDIKQNLEFITDRAVLQKGIPPKTYQYSLIRVNQEGTHIAFASNFNFSHIKTRIIMMNKKQSSPIHLSRYVVALPLALTLVCGFGISMAQQTNISVKEQVLAEQYTVTREGPAQTKVQPAATPQEATFSTRTKGGHVTITKADAAGAVTANTATNDAVQPKHTLSKKESDMVYAQLDKDRPVVQFDGERITLQEMRNIDPKTIKSMTVLTPADAMARFGDEAKGGAIILVSKED